MLKFRLLTYIILSILLASHANAATIYGTVYDFSLNKLNNARVDINTQPKQLVVAQNGTYSFNVPKGFYTLKAQLVQKNTVIASVLENITVEQDGSYVLDLILFPDIEEGVEDIDLDVDEDVTGSRNNSLVIITVALFIVLLIIALLYHFYFKSKKTELKPEEKKEESTDEYPEKIIKILKQEDGRITQKELRKHLPFSEAKISLMITELEHKGIVEKIKKGRGNIIILKKK